jgi:hypothetical protein
MSTTSKHLDMISLANFCEKNNKKSDDEVKYSTSKQTFRADGSNFAVLLQKLGP